MGLFIPPRLIYSIETTLERGFTGMETWRAIANLHMMEERTAALSNLQSEVVIADPHIAGRGQYAILRGFPARLEHDMMRRGWKLEIGGYGPAYTIPDTDPVTTLTNAMAGHNILAEEADWFMPVPPRSFISVQDDRGTLAQFQNRSNTWLAFDRKAPVYIATFQSPKHLQAYRAVRQGNMLMNTPFPIFAHIAPQGVTNPYPEWLYVPNGSPERSFVEGECVYSFGEMSPAEAVTVPEPVIVKPPRRLLDLGD